MKKILFILMAAMTFGGTLNAQNEADAIRYSYLMPTGTARFTAMGGSFSALGGDFSVLSINPAGIGIYKRSEFAGGVNINIAKGESTYLNFTSDDIKTGFNFPNVGIVFSGDVANNSGQPEWKNIQFGFGVNRLANFNNCISIEGHNPYSSIVDVYGAYAQGINFTSLNQYDTKLAFDTYLLDTLGGPSSYVQAVSGGVLQQKGVTSSGGINEMVFTLGGNYNDKFYLGGTFGFPFLRYTEDAFYKETDDKDSIAGFKSLSVNDELKTNGVGFNFKLGMIYRITDWVRISAAFHTPTIYQMHDEYRRVISSDLETNKYSSSSPEGIYDYKFVSPMRLNAGIAFVIKKQGSISAEYEMVDYSQSRFRSTDPKYDFFNTNDAINRTYTTSNVFRAGTEWLLNPFAIRAGYAYYSSPFNNNLNDMASQVFSGGFGYREKDYFLDFAFTYLLRDESYYLYSSDVMVNRGKPIAESKNKFTNMGLTITMGVKF